MNKIFATGILLAITFATQAQITEYNNKVGIGISQPTHKLEIAGTTALKAAYVSGVEVEQLRFSRSDRDIRYHSIHTIHDGGSQKNYLQFRVHNGGASPFTEQQKVMTLVGNGNVGIGTQSPTAKLHIVNTGTIGGIWNPIRSFITIQDQGNSSDMMTIDPNELYASNGLHIGVKSGGTIKFRTISESSYTDYMVINSGGNVGIGTTTPDSKLAVNGNIRAKEIKLETANWPDYVFDADYQPMTLQETKAYIAQHGHLPGLKSAAEYEQQGVNMLELNQKLLEKIEELTLHAIEQEERLTSQTKRMDEQDQSIDQLKEQLTNILKSLEHE